MAVMQNIAVRDLGRIGYTQAFALQQELHAKVLAGEEPPTILLLEHDPVITLTRRENIGNHLIASRELLASQGIELVETDRGGDITYHGPGQLVAYPIVPLQPLGLNVRQYVCALEAAIIQTLAEFGVTARRDPAGIGVWVDAPQPAKIAAIGVRVRRWVTLHGLALNVTTHLAHFAHIVPCGLTKPVTSLQQLLGNGCPPMARVKEVLASKLRSSFTAYQTCV